MAAPMCDVFAFCREAAAQARRALELRYIGSTKGKGLFATRKIRKGETIFVEKPVVSAQFLWNALYKYKACDHCLRALETAEENAQRLLGRFQALPHPEQCGIHKDLHQICPSCQVVYCSPECRQAAWDQYHQVLCLGPSREDPNHPLNKLQEAWRVVIDTPAGPLSQPLEPLYLGLPCVLLLNVLFLPGVDWFFQGQLEVLRLLFTEALYEEHLSRWFSPDGFRSLFALVGTNGQGMGTSSLSQWVHACDALELPPQEREQLDAFIDQLYKDIEKETGEFLNCEGSGLFVLQSCCNHSCIPNAEASFPDNNFLLHLTALEDIQPGEEICISYLDCCQRERSRHSRHKALRENYLFICSCPKCLAQADDPDVTSEEEEEEGEGEPDDAELEDEMTDV
ncbi:histone-lysine N-trimethyltransferase SMYD5 [Heteronotia binoei]|uniref:histone-lysine N-trimethyltransferase SMYD5 n=1 Tax=Heteronotia binoei TaxID=13085 RepID=UPI00292D121E|nr:histone-lysine N-trimethyltransferase SMYD5 [Heteronotia binoei]